MSETDGWDEYRAALADLGAVGAETDRELADAAAQAQRETQELSRRREEALRLARETAAKADDLRDVTTSELVRVGLTGILSEAVPDASTGEAGYGLEHLAEAQRLVASLADQVNAVLTERLESARQEQLRAEADAARQRDEAARAAEQARRAAQRRQLLLIVGALFLALGVILALMVTIT